MDLTDYKKLAKEFFEAAEELDKKEGLSTLWILPPESEEQKKEFRVFLRTYRILVGVYVELLLKALYLKNDYLVFEIKKPIYILDWMSNTIAERTLELNTLINKNNLRLIFPEKPKDFIKELKEGLEIIQEWRNCAAHSVTIPEHIDSDHKKVSKVFSYLRTTARDAFKDNNS